MTASSNGKSSSKRLSLAAWSRAQAIAMLGAVGVCAAVHAAWPVALVAPPAFAALLFLGRAAYTPQGGFGAANAVTTLRALMTLAVCAPPALLGTRSVLALVCLVLACDLLDGALARRLAQASPFGAHFDMETDALLVLVVTLRLWLGEGFAPWVLFAGLLRYAYVLWLWVWPGTGREAPRSRFGRYAFACLMFGLCAGLALPEAWGLLGVGVGTLAVSGSFARSCYFSRLSN